MSLPIPLPDKITGRHRDRVAIVYVRQSTPQQVGRHRESTRLQYGLADRALQLGWARERILVIDEDLGRSGASARPARISAPGRRGRPRPGRPGARHRDVPAGPLVSRLAPAARDLRPVGNLDRRHRWRLRSGKLQRPPLLGLKGTMSEAELHI